MWLMNPKDIEALEVRFGTKEAVPLKDFCFPNVELRGDGTVKRGYVLDTDFPELGELTFEQFNVESRIVQEKKDKELREACKKFHWMMYV